MIKLLNSKELTLSLDPVKTEDRVLSVAFDVVAEMKLPFQKAKIEIKECWFGHAALNEFESRLKDLVLEESGHAVLANMSDTPIFTIAKSGTEVRFLVYASDSVGTRKAGIEVSGYAFEVGEVLTQLKEYPKWW